MGTASTGTAIAGLSGIAATNATLAALGGGALAAGGAGIAGGMALLAGIVALPVVGLGVAAGAVMLRRRNKAVEEKLIEAEKQMRGSRPGYEALTDMLRKSSSILETIELHGTRALERWRAALPFPDQTGPRPSWDQLSDQQRRRDHDFTTIAACHLSILAIDPKVFIGAPDEATLREQISLSNATLDTR